jgi:hypothetical protein
MAESTKLNLLPRPYPLYCSIHPVYRPCSVRGRLRGIGGDSIPFYTNLYRNGLNPLQSPLKPLQTEQALKGKRRGLYTCSVVDPT